MVTKASTGKGARRSTKSAVARKIKPAVKPKAKAKPARKPAKEKTKARHAERGSPLAAAATAALENVNEELVAARQELARLAHAETVAKRNRDEHSAERDHLRAELDAVRLDLKTALADLEIARTESARADARTHAALVEAQEAKESQRRAEHVSDHVRQQLFEAQRDARVADPDPPGPVPSPPTPNRSDVEDV